MGRSRKFILITRTLANNALIKYFEGSQKLLIKHTRLGRTTVSNFLNGKPIGEGSFRTICLALGLRLKEVSEVAPASATSSDQSSDLLQYNEILSEKVKEHCRQNILRRHSQIRLLSGEETRVDRLYVDVWLLERPEYRQFDTSESLITSFDIEKDRLALSKRIQRNSGFEIANNESKLVILGKPGSGKTTFLKHLAVDWSKGKFQPDKVAVLIELRRIRIRTWDLIDVIGRELQLEREKTLDFLGQSKLLVLMDGLDEVPTDELRRNVQSQVRQVSEEYSKENRFILTCRTQIMKTIPSGFISVEVADFSSEQIKRFVQNWFTANGQSKYAAKKQWEVIQRTTTEQPALRELTATPVLLSLICVVLRDNGEIPPNRTELYEKGINWLLSHWNDEKDIESWEVGSEVYRQLSPEDKKALLIEIAAHKFENPENFVLFKQSELANQITRRLDLANTREGTDVLKSIEAQHGLLIERADELWSFSHLTFQEYFTVQWLTQLPSQQLAKKIADQQWKEVVELLIKSQQPADQLLRLIKQAADQSIAQETDIQLFLGWLHRQSILHLKSYRNVPKRAFFYYSLSLFLFLNLGANLSFFPSRSLSLSLDLVLDRALSGSDVDRRMALDSVLTFFRSLNLELDLDLNSNLDLILDLTLVLTLLLSSSLSRPSSISKPVVDTDLDLDLFLKIGLFLSQSLKLSPDFIECLNQLRNELPKLDRTENTKIWWSPHGTQWVDRLRQMVIKHRNISHDWQFTEEQQKQLRRYYEINKFLVNLMQIRGAVSEKCRTEIEEGLLLPRAEL